MKHHLALFSYRLILLILLPLILLYFLFRSRKNPAYRQRLLERLGFINQPFKQHGIVIHAASVGEVLALRTFVEKVLLQHPNIPIIFTTFTPTGSEQVIKLFGDRVQHCYLPLDFFFATSLFLKKTKPRTIVIMETELWPNLIAQAKTNNIKLMMVNGRISPATIKQYQTLLPLFAPCLAKFDCLLSQSNDNQQHFLTLGAKPQACEISGNIKYDMTISDDTKRKQQTLGQLLPENKKIWVVASTHPSEETLALNAYKILVKQYPELVLILVPRHPERFEEVTTLAQNTGFNTQIRSSNTKVENNTHIWILDTLGELMALYALADIVTVAGSFSSVGGHNPLEPAYFKKPIIVGNNMANFNDIMCQLFTQNAIIQLTENTSSALVEQVKTLLIEEIAAKNLGNNAFEVVMQNQGAVDISLQKLNALVND